MVKCVRVSRGSDDHPEVRCRLVAQELGCGERLDEIIPGTPSSTVVNLLLSAAAQYVFALMMFGDNRVDAKDRPRRTPSSISMVWVGG